VKDEREDKLKKHERQEKDKDVQKVKKGRKLRPKIRMNMGYPCKDLSEKGFLKRPRFVQNL
jgi:hypothetical protein